MLILASASIGRHRLLDQVGITHEVIVSNVREDQFEEASPRGLVNSLSIAKANDVTARVLSSENTNKSLNKVNCILGCDSVFVFQGEIFGKPRTRNEAIERWNKIKRQKTGSSARH